MGDQADYLIEQGLDQYYDHLAGHIHTLPDECPYCREEEE